jgi:DNA-binding IclR family transcriptional regulator
VSEQKRDESGRWKGISTEQAILKVFDTADAPFLTANEVADAVGIANSTANNHLRQMRENGLVDRKKTGARSVGWWAKVAPRLSEESIARVEQSRREIERGETVSHDDMKARLGMDG